MANTEPTSKGPTHLVTKARHVVVMQTPRKAIRPAMYKTQSWSVKAVITCGQNHFGFEQRGHLHYGPGSG